MCLVEVDGPRGLELCSRRATSRSPTGMEVCTDLAGGARRPRTACSSSCSSTTRSTARCATRAASARCRTRRSLRSGREPLRRGEAPLGQADRRSASSCCSTASAASSARRCTRFADEVAGEPLIDFAGRGDRSRWPSFPGEPFASYFCRQHRPDLPGRGAHCHARTASRRGRGISSRSRRPAPPVPSAAAVAVQSSAGPLVRFLGVDSDPVNQSWLCDKGRFGFEAVHSRTRLARAPLVRRDGELVVGDAGTRRSTSVDRGSAAGADWPRAPAPVGVIGGARLANEDAYAWAKLAKGVHRHRQRRRPARRRAPRRAGGRPARATIDEAWRPARSSSLRRRPQRRAAVLYLRLRHAAVERGARHRVTPVPTRLARVATASLADRPGEAGAVGRRPGRRRRPASRCRPATRPCGSAGRTSPAATATASSSSSAGRRSPSRRRGRGRRGVLAAGVARRRGSSRRSGARTCTARSTWARSRLLPGRVTLEEGRDWFTERRGARLPARTRARHRRHARGRRRRRARRARACSGRTRSPTSPTATGHAAPSSAVAVRGRGRDAARRLHDARRRRAPGGHLRRAARDHDEHRGPRHVARPEGHAAGVARADWMIAAELADAARRRPRGRDPEADLGRDRASGAVVLGLHGRGARRRRAARDGIVVPLTAGLVSSEADGPAPAGPDRPDRRARHRSVEEQGAPLAAASRRCAWGRARRAAEAAGRPPARARTGGRLVSWPSTRVPARPGAALARRRRLLVAPRGQPAAVRRRDARRKRVPSLAPWPRRQELRLNPDDLGRLGVRDGDQVRVSAPGGELALDRGRRPTVSRAASPSLHVQPAAGGRATSAIRPDRHRGTGRRGRVENAVDLMRPTRCSSTGSTSACLVIVVVKVLVVFGVLLVVRHAHDLVRAQGHRRHAEPHRAQPGRAVRAPAVPGRRHQAVLQGGPAARAGPTGSSSGWRPYLSLLPALLVFTIVPVGGVVTIAGHTVRAAARRPAHRHPAAARHVLDRRSTA